MFQDVTAPDFLRGLFEMRRSLSSINADDCFLLFCRHFLESNSEVRVAWAKRLLSELADGAPGAKKQSDIAKFLSRSAVRIPPSDDLVRALALDSSLSHLNAARDCADPCLGLAALCLSVCPDRARNGAVQGRELLLRAVAVLNNFSKQVKVIPKTLSTLREPQELVTFSERLFRDKKKLSDKDKQNVMEFVRDMVAANEIDQSAEGLAMNSLALQAMKKGSFELCDRICDEIMESYCKEAWKACFEWAVHTRCEQNRRMALLTFAAASATEGEIGEITKRKEEQRILALKKEIAKPESGGVAQPFTRKFLSQKIIYDPVPSKELDLFEIPPTASITLYEVAEALKGGSVQNLGDLQEEISRLLKADIPVAVSLLSSVAATTRMGHFATAYDVETLGMLVARLLQDLTTASAGESSVGRNSKNLHRLSIRQLYLIALDAKLPSFEDTKSFVSKQLEMRHLAKLGEDVDLDRFVGDASYREDTVLGLALVGTKDAYWVALDMAERYELPTWLVSLAHLKGLFMAPSAAADVEEALQISELVTPLLEAAGEECYAKIDDDLFPLVDGTDPDIVLSFINVVDRIGGTQNVFGVSKKQLRRVVDQMKRGPRLDFKVILRGSAEEIASMLKDLDGEDRQEALMTVEEATQKFGREASLLSDVRKRVTLERVYRDLRRGTPARKAMVAVSEDDVEEVLTQLCFSASFEKLSFITRTQLLNSQMGREGFTEKVQQLVESSPEYSAVCARATPERGGGEEAAPTGDEPTPATAVAVPTASVASRFMQKVMEGVPASLNILSVNLDDEDLEDD